MLADGYTVSYKHLLNLTAQAMRSVGIKGEASEYVGAAYLFLEKVQDVPYVHLRQTLKWRFMDMRWPKRNRSTSLVEITSDTDLIEAHAAALTVGDDFELLLSQSSITPEEEDLLRKVYVEGWYAREIGEVKGLSEARVSQLVQDARAHIRFALDGTPVPVRKKRPRTYRPLRQRASPQRDTVVALWMAGTRNCDIARRLNISPSTVKTLVGRYCQIRGQGVRELRAPLPPTPPSAGELLTRLVDSGMTYAAVAEKLGLNHHGVRSTVSRHRRRIACAA